MKVCEYQHDAIVFLGEHCPLCLAIRNIEALTDALFNNKQIIATTNTKGVK